MNVYDVIKTVAITEKTTMLQENDQYTFVIHPRASKSDVKQAIEELFDRKVKSVNVINRKGKKRRTRFGVGKKADTRKAIVTLKDGEDALPPDNAIEPVKAIRPVGKGEGGTGGNLEIGEVARHFRGIFQQVFSRFAIIRINCDPYAGANKHLMPLDGEGRV